jgi:hypothetical protein
MRTNLPCMQPGGQRKKNHACTCIGLEIWSSHGWFPSSWLAQLYSSHPNNLIKTAFTDISVPKTWVEEAHTVCTENAVCVHRKCSVYTGGSLVIYDYPHAMQGIISFFCYGWNLLPESRRGPGGAWNCVVQSADAPDLGRQKITDHDIVSDCQIWSFLGLLNMGEVYSSMPYLAQVAKLQRVTSANGTPPYAHCAAAVAFSLGDRVHRPFRGQIYQAGE